MGLFGWLKSYDSPNGDPVRPLCWQLLAFLPFTMWFGNPEAVVHKVSVSASKTEQCNLLLGGKNGELIDVFPSYKGPFRGDFPA